MSGFVYAIGDGRGAVKIGYAADPIRRVSELAVGRTEPLTLLGMARGTRADEKQAHMLLWRWNIGGEWFRHEGLVAHLVAMMPPPPKPRAIVSNIGRRRLRGQPHPLAAWRVKAGVKQADLAQQIGVLQGTISKIEGGNMMPSAHICLAIERVTGGIVTVRSLAEAAQEAAS